MRTGVAIIKRFRDAGSGRSRAAFAVLFPVLCLVSGCRKQNTSIVVIPRSTDARLWPPFRQGVEAAAQGTPLRPQWQAPPDEGDIENQLNLLEASTKRGDRGILFAPDETLASRSPVLEAVARHIPVVVVDDDFGPPPGRYLAYVRNDEAAGVKLAAARLNQQLHGKGTLAILGINVRQEGSITREVLLEQALAQYAPGIKIVLRQYGRSVITNQQICQGLLEGGAPPDAIIALSSAATRGAYYAKIAGPHVSSAVLIGFDQDVMIPLRKGDVDAVVVQDTRATGQRAMQNLVAMGEGQSVPGESLIPPYLVTRENLDTPEITDLLTPTLMTEGKGIAEPKASPADIDSAAAALSREAKMHELQPGVQPIGSFIRLPGNHPAATVQGIVVSLPPMLEVQDETSSLLISSFTSPQALKLGDFVTVHGDLTSERFRSLMENASIKVLWSERPVPPLAVTATQLTANYRGQWIEVEGTVLSEKRGEGPLELVLQDRRQTFRVLAYGVVPGGQNFAPGSRVRVRGSATSLPQLTNGIFPFGVVADRVELLSPPPWWSPAHIAWLVIGVLAVLFALQWLLHAVRRWQLRVMLREREQLAYEVHDTLAQSFTGIAYQLQAARDERQGQSAVQKHIESALHLVSMSHREASRTIAALRPQHHDARGILAALQQSAERLSSGGDLVVRTELNARSNKLPLEVADALIRIGEEAISNAIQHGNCHTLWMALQISGRIATLTVKDDGVGFLPGEEEPKGLGITGMRTRAERIKATLSIVSAPGQGTSIVVVCPLVFTGSLLHWVRARAALLTL